MALLGRKLTEGDSTDSWMIRFCGQLVRRGVTNGSLVKQVERFYEEYFEDNYTDEETSRWLKTKMESAIQMDRANYPDDYEIDGTRKKPEPEEVGAKNLDFFTYSRAEDLLATVKEQKFWTEPLLPVGNIVQLVGFNGHGKSFFLTSLFTGLAHGSCAFGPFRHVSGPPRIVYFDYDNPGRTLLERIINQARAYGDPGDNLMYWSPSVMRKKAQLNMNLLTQEGADNMLRMLNRAAPDIVVWDSIRNGFAGMEENGAQDWAKVNALARYVRDQYEATVVLVHHRNKPGQDGLGREAGSTAQLTDIDTQAIVTQVYREQDVAKAKAGVHDEKINIQCLGWDAGPTWMVKTPFGYMQSQVDALATKSGRDMRIRMVSQISYGKVRNETEQHQSQYIGYAEYLDNGEPVLLATKSRRQYAEFLHNHMMPVPDIARELMVPMTVVREWLKK